MTPSTLQPTSIPILLVDSLCSWIRRIWDEPLSNLDAKLRSTIRTELQELQQELDVTTVYVTHDQTEAMGNRIAVLNEGKLQQVGTAEAVYRSPTNEFVAGFIGSPSINLFTAEVDGVDVPSPGRAGSTSRLRTAHRSTAWIGYASVFARRT